MLFMEREKEILIFHIETPCLCRTHFSTSNFTDLEIFWNSTICFSVCNFFQMFHDWLFIKRTKPLTARLDFFYIVWFIKETWPTGEHFPSGAGIKVWLHRFIKDDELNILESLCALKRLPDAVYYAGDRTACYALRGAMGFLGTTGEGEEAKCLWSLLALKDYEKIPYCHHFILLCC